MYYIYIDIDWLTSVECVARICCYLLHKYYNSLGGSVDNYHHVVSEKKRAENLLLFGTTHQIGGSSLPSAKQHETYHRELSY
jgi:hypothetical protein